jgi:hypothetical protein
MSVDAKYETTATASGGGRDGKTALADGTMSFDLVIPKELGGPGGAGANPEKLFALGYSACFLSAMRTASLRTKIKRSEGSTVTATIGVARARSAVLASPPSLTSICLRYQRRTPERWLRPPTRPAPIRMRSKPAWISRQPHVHDSTVRCAIAPIARYFAVVGSALAVLLLIAGWCLPEPPPSFPDRPDIIDGSAIRIRSEHKWPDKVVLDTSQPTIPPPVVAGPPAQSPLPSDQARGQANLEAMVELKPDSRPAATDQPPVQVRRGVARTVRSRRVARGPIAHRLARAETGWGCCSFDRSQASANAMPSKHAASSWPFD